MKASEGKTGNKRGVARERFRPKVLVSLESLLKISVTFTLDSVSGKLSAII